MLRSSDIVVCDPIRSPIANFQGAFEQLTPAFMAATLLTRLIQRTGIATDVISDVILGQSYPSSEAPPIGRVAALDAGLPVTVTGMQVDRRCGSGLQAVLTAATQIQAGVSDVVVAGGVESMSMAPLYTVEARRGFASPGLMLHDGLTRGRSTAGGRNHPVPGGMIETAENLRREFDISRAAQDEFALLSQQRAHEAKARGYFDDEIESITVSTRRSTTVVSEDEFPKPETTIEVLAGLKPIMRHSDSEATVTPGNASGQNDAASLCLVMTRRRAEELGLSPLVALKSWALAGVEPSRMGTGPVPATQLALTRAGLALSDIDIIELNEAFAAQALAVLQSWGLADADLDRVNPLGGAIALGHPIGATGCRILATMSRHLQRTDGRYALETMCIGGGQGLAAIFERA